MARKLEDWLEAFVTYASTTESPKQMHFWSGVSAIAGALRRKVWFDQIKFKWYPSFYIVFVAPPGIVAKSTTVDIAMDLLKEVPGIKFGPDNATWQEVPASFEAAFEMYEYNAEWHPMSAVTYLASELGNLIDFRNQEMINLLITLWDGRKSYEKRTKGSGNNMVQAPWINIIGCTTPQWIATNLPAIAIGGGFTSRCVFIYADKKERFIPYLDEVTPGDEDALRDHLIHDLAHISANLVGPYALDPKAREWGHVFYHDLWNNRPITLKDDHFDGYIARKQTHLHKTAMVIAAARRDERIIKLEDMETASVMLTTAEGHLNNVFKRVGESEEASMMDRVIRYVQERGSVDYDHVYRMVYSQCPDFRDFEGLLNGIIRAGFVELQAKATGGFTIKAKNIL